MFLSRLNEINGSCEKILPVSGSFCSNILFILSLENIFPRWPNRTVKNLLRANLLSTKVNR